MYKRLVLLLLVFYVVGAGRLTAQDLKTSVRDNKELDSLRKKDEAGLDSVIFTSRYVRYTTLALTKDSIQTVPLDTSLNGFHNFSVLVQPRRPTASLGNLGLAAMPLLFEPSKTIGFDAGFHALDFYAMTQDDVKYYQARTPFTSLYYVSAGDVEQVFKVIHSQNINKNWNFGANFNRSDANGIFASQRGDHLNAALFSWYQSNNKRYNLWVNGVFNTLKADENGSITNEEIYDPQFADQVINRIAEPIRLNESRQLWRKNSILLRQSYFVGRIDSASQEISDKILPTNKVVYTFRYDKNSYAFQKNQADDFTVLPRGIADASFTNDSTSYSRIQNEFIYSFFLRAKSKSIIKNELKLDAGIKHDFFTYNQLVLYSDKTPFYDYSSSFQNISLLGAAGYRFSNRMDLNVNVEQIFQGRNIGDFLYEAKSNVLLSNAVGRVVLGAYYENKSPEEVYNRYFGNHYNWTNNFDRTKTVNLSFKYLNDKYKVDATANYYLINNYLYFRSRASGPGANLQDSLTITPEQLSGSLNLLKIAVGKKLSFGKFHLDSYIVYQKTDNSNVLRTPEFYTFNSFYINQTFFKALKTNVGFDIRYNTPFKNYSYSPAAGQFYIGDDRMFDTTPIVDVWVKASLRKANLFIKCDYVNQGFPLKGYYTVNQYPMQDRILFKFGVQWNFYD